MNKIFKTMLLGLLAAAISSWSFAADKGSADEAVANVKKAVAYLKANGKDKAFAEFNNPAGQFSNRDLYIFVFDKQGVALSHGANKKLIGKNMLDLQDADGKHFIKKFYEVDKAWVDYKWQHPSTKMIEQKSTYIEKVDDLLIGCGIYKS
jgi:cytochrome c